jgi:iron complex outermembrane receptor protein
VSLLAGLASLPALANAQLVAAASLADLTLEQLSDIVVSSVARHEQRLAEAPASVFVITGDDIRRSGVRTIAEALRLAPNLQVARADANQYAITARGFGNVLANKLLVLLDGRTVYSPLFSGVFWESRDPMIEDIDRIEVVSGPQSTWWGTNAVNGTINIITKTASATQGTLVAAGGGNRDWTASVRYGAATADGGHFRLYARALGLDDTRTARGASVDDASERARMGFRYDRASGDDAWTIQGDAYVGDIDQPSGGRDISGGNLLARWQRTYANGDATIVQAYWDRTRLDQQPFRDDLDTFDVEAHGRLRAGERHAVTAGGGYRYQDDRVRNAPGIEFRPPKRTLTTAYAFAQDEVELSEALTLIGGIKAEHNDYTGLEWLPTARMRWQASADHMLWGAVSRTVRAPARIDREFFTQLGPVELRGGSDFDSEVANVFELGARGRLAPAFTYSLTAFHHEHDRLRSIEPTPEGFLVVANGIEGRTRGVEGWIGWQPLPNWRLLAGGVELRQDLRVEPGTVDVGGLAGLGNDPRRSYVLRSSLDLPYRQELDVMLRYVGERPAPLVPAYTAVDLRWGWHVNRDVELSLTLENLTDDRHAEWGPAPNRVEFERAWHLKVVIRL